MKKRGKKVYLSNILTWYKKIPGYMETFISPRSKAKRILVDNTGYQSGLYSQYQHMVINLSTGRCVSCKDLEMAKQYLYTGHGINTPLINYGQGKASFDNKVKQWIKQINNPNQSSILDPPPPGRDQADQARKQTKKTGPSFLGDAFFKALSTGMDAFFKELLQGRGRYKLPPKVHYLEFNQGQLMLQDQNKNTLGIFEIAKGEIIPDQRMAKYQDKPNPTSDEFDTNNPPVDQKHP